jgi:hypothetical protein
MSTTVIAIKVAHLIGEFTPAKEQETTITQLKSADAKQEATIRAAAKGN